MEEELRETRFVWDVIGIGEVIRREECFTTLQSVKIIPRQTRVAELVLCITKRYTLKIVHVYAPTSSYSEVGKQTKPMEAATGKFRLGMRNERGDKLVEWATSRKYKITNQKKAGRKWTWKSPDGEAKNEIDYILKKQARYSHRRNCHQPSQHWK
ncbi:MAG: hypothetical protein M3H12_04185 [Chromatiales bacterium]